MGKMPLTNKKIGVLMGGISSEREISLKSGMAVYNALKKLGYDAVQIDVGENICDALIRNKIEVAFIVLHGGYGENGSIQGLLEVLGIPYTGSGVLASALAMDKEISKKVFKFHSIPVPEYYVVKKEFVKDFDEDVFQKLNIGFDMPWVVKPATEGSSIGVSIVRNKLDFYEALKRAFLYGSRVIIERFIDGKEVHIGILNGRVLGGVEVRPSLEFYNYEAKYTKGLTDYILPPELIDSVYERAKEVARLAHIAIGCKGGTRVDLRIDNSGNPYVLEINTIPGMTETSLLPMIAKSAGYDFTDLVEELIKGAIYES